MFTGIIESLGRVKAISGSEQGRRIELEVGAMAAELEVGDSLAVNGVCLTIVETGPNSVAIDVVLETLRRTGLGAMLAGDQVNLELPLAANGRFDGHIVQGHVDGIAAVTAVTEEGTGRRLAFDLNPRLHRYVVEKGSITVDGVSMTVASVTDRGFEVAVISHTLAATNLGLRRPGDQVNLEFDVIGKYVERMLEQRS
ncbi:MAG TPA: riboflavin synthase [Acidimicrobiia bacterium]|nr:riboflavin synthase [Acidimicrobiia bacterium]